MIIVLGKFEVGSPEDVARVEKALTTRMAHTRKEPGNIEYSFAVEIGASNIVHIVEKWESEDMLNIHLQVPDEAFSAALATANIKAASVVAYTATGERVLR